MSGTTDLPAGIAWRREGPHVVGRVLVVREGGKREHVATVRYATDDDAAVAVGHLLDAIASRP